MKVAIANIANVESKDEEYGVLFGTEKTGDNYCRELKPEVWRQQFGMWTAGQHRVWIAGEAWT